ncbi:MAG: alpha-amylase family glycosyl hydrolase [Acidobacteriota bacterium]|nr:alpha-amylase family glycosyl hydrolase [Acidobacteriota bacterium]
MALAGWWAVPASAAELRMERVVPGEAGEWHVEVAVKNAAKAAESLVFSADGTELAASTEVLDKDRLAVHLAAVPADATRLTVTVPGRRGGDSATVILGPRSSGAVSLGVEGWTIYHVMMGYFRNANPSNDGEVEGWRHRNYAGGDLQGVLEKADYLADLGVDAVWLSPLFAARTSHGYDVTNYYRIGDAVAVPDDPEASLELFRQVVKALHQRGVKVILDLPLNHANRGYDREAGDPGGHKPRATSARQEAEKLWDSWDAGYRYWNFDHQPTRRFLKDVALHWLVKENVDGLRLDYVRGVPHDFWAELYAEVQAAKPGAFLVGECWADGEGVEANIAEIAKFYEPVTGAGMADPGPQFSSLLDFPMQILLTEVFAGGGSLESVEDWLQGYEHAYGTGARPTFFLDNHDLSRFLSWAGEGERLVAAVGFLASLSEPWVLFYGTEAGLADGAPKRGFNDASRIAMPWVGLEEGTSGAVYEPIRQFLRARQRHPALRQGGRRPLVVEEDLLIWVKETAEETALVAVHLGEQARTVQLATGLVDLGELEAVAGGASPERGEDGWAWRLEPLSTAISIGASGDAAAATDTPSTTTNGKQETAVEGGSNGG